MVMIFSGLWGIGSSLAVSLNCDASSTMTVQNVKYCPNQVSRSPHGSAKYLSSEARADF